MLMTFCVFLIVHKFHKNINTNNVTLAPNPFIPTISLKMLRIFTLGFEIDFSSLDCYMVGTVAFTE